MNVFSAIGSRGSSNSPSLIPAKKSASDKRSPSDTSKAAAEIAKDLLRRTKDMGLFSAMANSGGRFGSPDSLNSHMSSGRSSPKTNGNDDTEYRKKEMNVFSAIGSRGSSNSPSLIPTQKITSDKRSPSDTSKAAAEIAKDLLRRTKDMGIFSAMANSGGRFGSP